jgi:short subunit dehydrogenase-like uncharacterized protein
MTETPRPIAVYGATGFTGKLVTAELARRGAQAVLCGRNAEKLAAAAAPHGFETRVAAADDVAALTAAFTGCAAVIACAGPFLEVGDPAVRAAIAAGCHYVDTTGETPFIERVVREHGPAAKAAGVALVSGMGFDYLPGDLACALAAEDAGPLERLVVAYAIEGFTPTRGTARSALLMLSKGSARELLRPPLRHFDYPAPHGRQPVAPYPAGETITAPLHVDTPEVIAVVTATTFAPHARVAPAVGVLIAPVGLLMRSARVRALADKAIDRLPEGPADAARDAVRWSITAEARPRGDGAPKRATVRGSDVYGITAVTAVEGALRMAAPGYDRSGGLAPAQAYEARDFLAALAPHGVTVVA